MMDLVTKVLSPGVYAPLLFCLLLVSGYVFHVWYRLSHVPGPFWGPLSFFRLMTKGSIYEDLPALDEKYGPLVRIGPNIVMYSDPDTFRRLNNVRSRYTKGSFYSSVRVPPVGQNTFTEVDPEKHKELKTKVLPGYSGREHQGFEPTIDRNIASFITLIEQKYLSTPSRFRPFDMAKRPQFFSLDVIADLGYGEPFGFVGEDKDVFQYLEQTDAYWPMLALVVCLPFVTGLFSTWPLRLVMPGLGDENGAGAIFGFAHKHVMARLQPGAKKKADMLQSFIDAGLTEEELKQEIWVETLSGTDTVATAIRMTILCLLSTPTAYAKLQREIDEGITSGRISSPIKDAEARAMPYLQAVIKEGLRRYPPATGLMSKVVPQGGDTVQGYDLPGGTELAINIVGITHREEIFGQDAHIFRPERWLDEGLGEEKKRAMVSAVDMVFGGGRGTCPGKYIGLIEINKLIVELFRRFDMAIAKPEKPMTLFHGIFWVTNDYTVRITRRETVGV